MYETLLGKASFREGLRLYLARHDGQACTCEQFYACMAEAANCAGAPGRLEGLFEWYSQSGTPDLHVRVEHKPQEASIVLHMQQARVPARSGRGGGDGGAGAPPPPPLLIPVAVGVLGPDGSDVSLTAVCQVTADGEKHALLFDGGTGGSKTVVLPMTCRTQSFVLQGVPPPGPDGRRPVVSLLRGFSAPVQLISDLEYHEYVCPPPRRSLGRGLGAVLFSAASFEGHESWASGFRVGAFVVYWSQVWFSVVMQWAQGLRLSALHSALTGVRAQWASGSGLPLCTLRLGSCCRFY